MSDIIEKFKKTYGLDIYPYTDDENGNEITIIILESGRFFFLPSIVTCMYKPRSALRINNRKGTYTYSKVKEIYNLKEKSINNILRFYGKEWISGRGFGTASADFDYVYLPKWVKDRLDFIPEYSDCPQKKEIKEIS